MHKGPQVKGQAPEKPAVFVTLSESDYLSVADAAERDGLSMSAYVRMLVRRHLESLSVAA